MNLQNKIHAEGETNEKAIQKGEIVAPRKYLIQKKLDMEKSKTRKQTYRM